MFGFLFGCLANIEALVEALVLVIVLVCDGSLGCLSVVIPICQWCIQCSLGTIRVIWGVSYKLVDILDTVSSIIEFLVRGLVDLTCSTESVDVLEPCLRA